MAYSLALSNPKRFAALAVLSSWLPKELIPELAINRSGSIAADTGATRNARSND